MHEQKHLSRSFGIQQHMPRDLRGVPRPVHPVTGRQTLVQGGTSRAMLPAPAPLNVVVKGLASADLGRYP